MSRRAFTEATEFGIALALVGAFLFVVQDSAIKWLSSSLAIVQILFLRNLIAMGLLWSGAAATGRPIVFKTNNPGLMLARSLIGVVGWYCFFAGLKYLPLATVMALFFSFPIFLTALSVPILGEKVGPRRWAAVLVGFCGVLVITRPGAALEWPMLYVLGASLSWALVAILTRKLGKTESTGTMVFYALASFVAIMAVPLYWIWAAPSTTELVLISLAALV
ncbi:MAG: DMT family transporter, partial [Rhizobiales bacterium]|nr:DMT family transporter [Hyphomicrobiales bacterium]